MTFDTDLWLGRNTADDERARPGKIRNLPAYRGLGLEHQTYVRVIGSLGLPPHEQLRLSLKSLSKKPPGCFLPWPLGSRRLSPPSSRTKFSLVAESPDLVAGRVASFAMRVLEIVKKHSNLVPIVPKTA